MRVLFYARGVEQLGVGYLMSYLEKMGHKVELIFDPGLDNNLYYRLGALKFLNRWSSLIQDAVDWKPDLVAFLAVTNIFPFALQFARKLKARLDVPFVFGGVHPTVLPEYVLQHDEIDYVIRGEGEYSLEELATALANGSDAKRVPNLCYKENGRININQLRPLIHDLDELPFPRKDEFYREGVFKTQLYVITARGCPFRCSYCINDFFRNKLYKELPGPVPYVRRRSPGNVIAEIKHFRDRYPISHIYFVDETFVTEKKWTREFLERYQREIIDISFSFQCYPGFIDEDVARRTAEAGGIYAGVAIETANEDFRRDILRRRHSNEGILRAMRMLQKYDVKIGTSAIFGIPFESEKNRWETVRLVEESKPIIVYSYLMYPFPGTEIAKVALGNGFLSPKNWEKVKKGLSSYHQDSLLDLPDISNAATMAKLLPLYIKVPKFFKPLLKWMMKKRLPRLAHLLYIVTVPYVYSQEGCTGEWVADQLRVFVRFLFGRRKDAKSISGFQASRD